MTVLLFGVPIILPLVLLFRASRKSGWLFDATIDGDSFLSGGFAMPSYRAFEMEPGAIAVLRPHEFTARNDAEAFQRALEHLGKNDIELWEGDRLIKRLRTKSERKRKSA